MESVIWIHDNSAGLSAGQVKSQAGIKRVSKYWIIYQHIYQHEYSLPPAWIMMKLICPFLELSVVSY